MKWSMCRMLTMSRGRNLQEKTTSLPHYRINSHFRVSSIYFNLFPDWMPIIVMDVRNQQEQQQMLRNPRNLLSQSLLIWTKCNISNIYESNTMARVVDTSNGFVSEHREVERSARKLPMARQRRTSGGWGRTAARSRTNRPTLQLPSYSREQGGIDRHRQAMPKSPLVHYSM